MLLVFVLILLLWVRYCSRLDKSACLRDMEDVDQAIELLLEALTRLPALGDKYLKYSYSVVLFDELEGELKVATEALLDVRKRLDGARLRQCEARLHVKVAKA